MGWQADICDRLPSFLPRTVHLSGNKGHWGIQEGTGRDRAIGAQCLHWLLLSPPLCSKQGPDSTGSSRVICTCKSHC